MPTLKDVAREAGVSIASVSRFLYNKASVRQEAGSRIEAAIKKLDYRIDTAARSLKTGRFYRISIVSPATGPHYMEMIGSIENFLAESDYSTNIFFTHDPKFADTHREVPAKMKYADGFILMPLDRATDEMLIKDMQRKEEPFVILDGGRDYLGKDYHQVCIDNYNIGKKAAEVLYAKGHKDFLFIRGAADSCSSNEREAGFSETLLAEGITLEPGRFIPGNFHAGITMEYLDTHYQELPPFSAIFACNDLSALGAMKALQKQSLGIGDDYSIIGVDDMDILPYLPVGLSTFRQPLQTAGLVAGNMLIALIEGKVIREKKIILQAQYIERETVKTLVD